MKETWTPEPDQLKQFNELEPSEYMNVVALAGGKIQQPDPSGLNAARIIAHQSERIAVLEDLLVRDVQQFQDELDEASHRGECRHDLQALIEEHDRVLPLGEAV